MYLCPFEDEHVAHLQPLVLTRAVFNLRLGMRTLLGTMLDTFKGAELLLHTRRSVAAVMAQEHIALVNRIPDGLDVLFVNGRYIAEEGALAERLRRAARENEPGRVFVQGDEVVAAWVPNASNRFVEGEAISRATFEGLPEESVEGARLIGRLWDLMDELRPALVRDFAARTHGFKLYERPGATIKEGVPLLESEQIYVAPGAVVRAGAILNAEEGPIYIDQDAAIMEGAVLRGPMYVGPHTMVKVHADVEGSSFGQHCKVGGEVHDSILHSFSSKAHAGFLGNAYLGRWCNLGAGTNNSNLKNDYGIVDMYNAAAGEYEPTGRQFAGLIMGDHSKCGINTMFNTGTVAGVFCNIYGAGFPAKCIPPFAWDGPEAGFLEYRLDKALKVAEAVMTRRSLHLTDAEREMLTGIFEATRTERVRPNSTASADEIVRGPER